MSLACLKNTLSFFGFFLCLKFRSVDRLENTVLQTRVSDISLAALTKLKPYVSFYTVLWLKYHYAMVFNGQKNNLSEELND